MARNYGYDLLDGQKIRQLVITEDYVLVGTHHGTVHVEAGRFTLEGTLEGTLDIQAGVKAEIKGTQQGTISVGEGAIVTVTGAIQGATAVYCGATLLIEPSGRLAGTLANYGKVILRGVFGGERTGNGELRIEGEGYIKQPVIHNGFAHYEW